MIEFLLAQYRGFMELTAANPIAGSAVAVTLFGSLVVLVKSYGRIFWSSLWRALWGLISVTTIVRKDTLETYGWSENAVIFTAIVDFYSKTDWGKRYCKNFITTTRIVGGRRISIKEPGMGTYYFLYKGKLVMLRRDRTEEGDRSIDNLSITIFFNPHLLDEFIEECITIFDMEDMKDSLRVDVVCHGFDARDWRRLGTYRKRSLESIHFKDDVHFDVVKLIEEFQASEDWYIRTGIPYKLVIVLEGPPGTGKTSLVKAISSYFNKIISVIDTAAFSRSGLANILADRTSKHMILIEDFDSNSSTKSRNLKVINDLTDGGDVPVMPESVMPNSISESLAELFNEDVNGGLSGILNALDGIATPHGMILIMTTNCIEKIDSALIRPGRVDYKIHVGLLDDVAIRKYINFVFPDTVVHPAYQFLPITGAELQQLLHANKRDVEAFVGSIPFKMLDNVVELKGPYIDPYPVETLYDIRFPLG